MVMGAPAMAAAAAWFLLVGVVALSAVGEGSNNFNLRMGLVGHLLRGQQGKFNFRFVDQRLCLADLATPLPRSQA